MFKPSIIFKEIALHNNFFKNTRWDTDDGILDTMKMDILHGDVVIGNNLWQ